MTGLAREHSELADLAYMSGEQQINELERRDLDYEVLKNASTITGYQGTVFRDRATGDLVVAHRGTEFDQGVVAALQDGIIADGGMALRRFNSQSKDARLLTRFAVETARSHQNAGGVSPQVTVTGHSLGGTLAQITAHRFGLRGETFNAYGAASLGYRIPEGGERVVNHVMATDPVSAAARHYGQVVVYARPADIAALHAASYANDRNLLDPRSPLGSALNSLGAHRMDNFLDVEGGRRSVLSDPRSRALARQFEPMIDKYRGDVWAMRAATTVVARGGPGNLRDALGVAMGPRPAGLHDLAAAGEPGAGPRAYPPSSLPASLPQRERPRWAPLQGWRGVPLDSGLLHVPVQVPLRAAPAAGAQAAGAEPVRDVSAWLDRILEAGRRGDGQAVRDLTRAAAGTEAGRALRHAAIEEFDRSQALAQATAPSPGSSQPYPPPDRGSPRAPPVLRLG